MQPTIARTAKGPVEYRLEGSGPAVVVLNGGHCSRDSRLSHERLAGCGCYFLTPSRPGYDSTPLAGRPHGAGGRRRGRGVARLAGLDRASVIGIIAAVYGLPLASRRGRRKLALQRRR